MSTQAEAQAFCEKTKGQKWGDFADAFDALTPELKEAVGAIRLGNTLFNQAQDYIIGNQSARIHHLFGGNT